ncbi:hypothetical protein EDD15DRAFT_384920 [Pisolithus albus]|nr:hypothetical protein EDD15DRAFT_384920 [Pisolithus albus]
MVPSPQSCCMFSVSLYGHYSSFTASLYPSIMGSTGSGRSFIDKLAEPEGARAPHGVGSRTRDVREHADSIRYAEAEDHKAGPAMLEEAQKVTGVPVWHLEHFCPASVGLERASSMPMDDARSRFPVVVASTGTRIDHQPVAYPSTTIQWLWPVFRLPTMRHRVAINARESSTVPLLPNTSASRMESAGGSGSRSTFVRDLLAGTYTFFQTDLTRVEVDRIARSRGSQLLIIGPRVLDEGRRGGSGGVWVVDSFKARKPCQVQ